MSLSFPGNVAFITRELQQSRELALQTGSYQSSVTQHEGILKALNALSNSNSNSSIHMNYELLLSLRDKCKLEIKIMTDIMAEMTEITKVSSQQPNK